MNILKIKDFCLLLFLVEKGAYIYELAVMVGRPCNDKHLC